MNIMYIYIYIILCILSEASPLPPAPHETLSHRVWKRALTSFHQYPCKEARDPKGATPFLKAVGVQAVYVAQRLAEHSDVQAKNNLGKSARDLASYPQMVEFVQESYNAILS